MESERRSRTVPIKKKKKISPTEQSITLIESEPRSKTVPVEKNRRLYNLCPDEVKVEMIDERKEGKKISYISKKYRTSLNTTRNICKQQKEKIIKRQTLKSKETNARPKDVQKWVIFNFALRYKTMGYEEIAKVVSSLYETSISKTFVFRTLKKFLFLFSRERFCGPLFTPEIQYKRNIFVSNFYSNCNIIYNIIRPQVILFYFEGVFNLMLRIPQFLLSEKDKARTFKIKEYQVLVYCLLMNHGIVFYNAKKLSRTAQTVEQRFSLVLEKLKEKCLTLCLIVMEEREESCAKSLLKLGAMHRHTVIFHPQHAEKVSPANFALNHIQNDINAMELDSEEQVEEVIKTYGEKREIFQCTRIVNTLIDLLKKEGLLNNY